MGVNLIWENEKLRDIGTPGEEEYHNAFPKHKEVEDLEKRIAAIEEKLKAHK